MKKRVFLFFCTALLLGTGIFKGTVMAEANDEFYIEKIDNMPDDFIKGADISTVISQENSGVKYFNESGEEQDLFEILKDNGVNYIRIRVWNDPYNEEGQGYGAGNADVEKAIEIGKRATELGMKVLIDFHYSDFWADPGRQIAPKAWSDFTVDQKAEALYDFTKNSLNKMIEARVDIGMVQVGNETTGSGIAGESGDDRYKLYEAGSKAIREVDPNIKIVFHFTNPEKTSVILDYAKGLNDNDIDYDVFATSYYAFWHGTLENLTYVLNTVADTYNKETIIAETSYAYTLEDGDGQSNVVNSSSLTTTGGYPATVQGQANALRDVMNATVNAGSKALGVFYWEPAWIPVGPADRDANLPVWEQYGSGWASSAAIGYDTEVDQSNYGGSAWDNQALFDFNGKVLDSLKVFKYADEGLGILPEEEPEILEELEEPEEEVISLLNNSSFEDADMSSYQISQTYAKRETEDPKTGSYALHFYNADAVNFTAEQSINLEPGKYQFELVIQGGDTGDTEDIYTYAKIDSTSLATSSKVNLPGYLEWQNPVITFEVQQESVVTVGLAVKGGDGAWGTTDNWKLNRIGDVTPQSE